MKAFYIYTNPISRRDRLFAFYSKYKSFYIYISSRCCYISFTNINNKIRYNLYYILRYFVFSVLYHHITKIITTTFNINSHAQNNNNNTFYINKYKTIHTIMTTYNQLSYTKIIDILSKWKDEYPNLIKIYNAQDTFGVPSPGTCASFLPCKQYYFKITTKIQYQIFIDRKYFFPVHYMAMNVLAQQQLLNLQGYY